jgi:arylformamidase
MRLADGVMMRRIVLLILFAVLIAVPVAAQDVTVIADVPYLETGNPRHTLDLYLPEGEGFPFVMHVHGGAWVVGDKRDAANIGEALARKGIGVASVGYRLSPEVAHPQHAQDVAAAYAWLAENIADYGGDPQRIALSGHSAGGHLVSLLALDPQYLAAVGARPADLAGVIGYSGVYRIDDWILGFALGAFDDEDDGRQTASPLWLAEQIDGPETPPFLVLDAQFDYPPLIVQADLLAALLAGQGVPVAAHTIPQRNHSSIVDRIGSEGDPTTALVLAWLGERFAAPLEVERDCRAFKSAG